MCGRTVFSFERSNQITRHWSFRMEAITPGQMSPGHYVPVILNNTEGITGESSMRWEFRPGTGENYNAKIETITERPMWASVWAAGQRGLMPITDFYEMNVAFAATDASLLYAGCIWKKDTLQGTKVFLATMLTTVATDPVLEVHRRQPFLVAPKHAERWLNRDLVPDGERIVEILGDQPALVRAA